MHIFKLLLKVFKDNQLFPDLRSEKVPDIPPLTISSMQAHFDETMKPIKEKVEELVM